VSGEPQQPPNGTTPPTALSYAIAGSSRAGELVPSRLHLESPEASANLISSAFAKPAPEHQTGARTNRNRRASSNPPSWQRTEVHCGVVAAEVKPGMIVPRFRLSLPETSTAESLSDFRVGEGRAGAPGDRAARARRDHRDPRGRRPASQIHAPSKPERRWRPRAGVPRRWSRSACGASSVPAHRVTGGMTHPPASTRAPPSPPSWPGRYHKPDSGRDGVSDRGSPM